MEKKTIREIISENIKRLIKETGLKQKEFAKKVDISNSSVSKYKRGENFFPLEKVPLVIEVLNCNVNDLFSPLFDKIEVDKYLEDLLKKVRHIYRLPGGEEHLLMELHKLELYLKERLEKPQPLIQGKQLEV